MIGSICRGGTATRLAIGLLTSGLMAATAMGQPPSGGIGSVSGNPTGNAAQIPPGTTPPGGQPSAGISAPPGAGGARPGAGAATDLPPLGGIPALPRTGAVPPGLEGSTLSSWSSTGAMQPPPTPMPPQPLVEQPPGPLPIPALVRLPSVTLDHYGDGAGTVGSYLLWDHQLPHQYRISRYLDGNGKVGGPIMHLQWITPHASTVNAQGTLSYGPPGLHPGFFGFGLSFHPGYGYGGNALGTGALGGYPCYGGPGYPLHYGYPKFAYPYYEGIGQLYYDQPVVITDLEDAREFGPYTGASAYAYTHPSYTAEAAATGSFRPGTASFPDTSASNPAPEATFSRPERGTPGSSLLGTGGRFLGMTLEPGRLADGRPGQRIVSVLPGSTAQNAGLAPGDVILSIDGQPIAERDRFQRLASQAASGDVLKLGVVAAADGAERTVTVRVP